MDSRTENSPTRMTLILMLWFTLAQKLNTPKMASGPSTVSCSAATKGHPHTKTAAAHPGKSVPAFLRS